MKHEIPKYDPYTGQLNPYYEELTGEPNPFSFNKEESNKFKKVCSEISERLKNLPYNDGDGSDIGNEIGIIIAKHFSEDLGWDMDGFLFGVDHGIDLTLNKDKNED